VTQTLEGDRHRLRDIRERYFVEKEDCPEGRLGHLPMCRITPHSPESPIFCSCGLLHDLSLIKLLLADMIHPNGTKESWCQERQVPLSDYCPKRHKKERIEAVRVLHDIFGPSEMSDDEIREEAKDVVRLIQDVFGEGFLKTLDTEKSLKDYLDSWNEWRVTSDDPDSL
jgi:hypothetical protein